MTGTITASNPIGGCSVDGCDKVATPASVYQACDEHTPANMLPCPAWADRRHCYAMVRRIISAAGAATLDQVPVVSSKACVCGAEVKRT